MISPSMTPLYNPWLIVAYGIIQVLCGVGLVMGDIIQFATAPIYQTLVYTFTFSGALLGIFYIITGSFGIAAWKPLPGCTSTSSRKCLLITSMVMSILSCLSAIGMMFTFSVLLAVFASMDYHRCSDPGYDHREWCYGRGFATASFVFHAIMLAVSLGEAVIVGLNLCKLQDSSVRVYGAAAQPLFSGQYVGAPTVIYNPAQQGQVYFVPLQQGSATPQYGYSATIPAPSVANTGYLNSQKL